MNVAFKGPHCNLHDVGALVEHVRNASMTSVSYSWMALANSPPRAYISPNSPYFLLAPLYVLHHLTSLALIPWSDLSVSSIHLSMYSIFNSLSHRDHLLPVPVPDSTTRFQF